MDRFVSSRSAADLKISLIRIVFAKAFLFLNLHVLVPSCFLRLLHDKPRYVIRRDLEKSAAWKMGFMLSAAP